MKIHNDMDEQCWSTLRNDTNEAVNCGNLQLRLFNGEHPDLVLEDYEHFKYQVENRCSQEIECEDLFFEEPETEQSTLQ
ncbi:MAG: hypothetical protein HQM11_05575 [SAR324 cluster bacterium]|nr:hypothetical protein [SAR324 cluster bacterium]